MKTLFVVPSFALVGGVSTHYLGLKEHWKHNFRYVHYGRRKGIHAIFCLLPDFLYYCCLLCTYRPDIVVVNPSFRRFQIYRDGLYLWVAKLAGCKVVSFFHGWDFSYSQSVAKRPEPFRTLYNKSSLIYTLSQTFRNELINIGITVPIKLTTTKVTDALLQGFDIASRKGKIEKILYLARADKKKGLMETLSTFRLLHPQCPQLRLTLCGIGPDLAEAKAYVEEHAMRNVAFKGLVQGENLSKQYRKADLYILPSYAEGMPTTVLEAMAFGLPIVTRPVGGIVDFFVHQKMGKLVESLAPQDFAQAILSLIQQPDQTREISHTNYRYAQEHFLASKVAANMEKDFAALFSL